MFNDLKFGERIYFLHVRIGNSKSVFPLRFKNSLNESFYTLGINILKIVYFFSEVKENINQFLSNTEITFKICDSANSSSELLSGSTKTIKNFSLNTFEGQK